MYCPNCAAINNDDAKFCRGCGANLSLVPQAMTGQLPEAEYRGSRRRGKHNRPPNIADGIQKMFLGIGFLCVSIAIGLFGPGGRGWWFWLLIPAFASLGKGISEIVSAKLALNSDAARAAMPPVPRAVEMPPRTTGPVEPPPSVTENTTRHLDATTDPYKR
jgi:hypothetical protein